MKKLGAFGLVVVCCFAMAFCNKQEEGESSESQVELVALTDLPESPVVALAPPRPPAIRASFSMDMPLEYDVFTPQVALKAVMSNELQYLGVDEPYDYGDGIVSYGTAPSCLWYNSQVLVHSGFCYKYDDRATSFTVYSLRGDAVNFYADTTDESIPVKSVKRDGYVLFRTTFTDLSHGIPNLDSGMTFDDFQDFYKSAAKGSAHVKGMRSDRPYCIVNSFMGGNDDRIPCNDKMLKAAADKWVVSSNEFLENPGEDWYRFIQILSQLGKEYGPKDAEQYQE